MALKGARKITDGTNIEFFGNTAMTAAEKGEVVVFDGQDGAGAFGSGVSRDDNTATVSLVISADGGSGQRVAGLLLNDVVNYDLTRQHLNQHKDEVQAGGKVTLLRHGVVTTDMISGTPLPGIPAYFIYDITQSKAVVTPTKVVDGPSTESTASEDNTYRVGTFLSAEDSDGFATIEVNIP